MPGYLTDYSENKELDFMRGQGRPAYPTNWYFALGSAASDGSFSELSGTGYARVALTRVAASWTNTQNDGSTAASNGTSHSMSNVAALSWGNPGAAWGTASVVALCDAPTGGNVWAYAPLASPIVVTTGSPNPVQVAAGALVFALGLTGGMSDFLANAILDDFFRGIAYNWPASLYLAAYTAAPTTAGGGTEVSGGGYARATLVPSLTSLCGTQGAGTTTASSGTSGVISNNATISYPVPTADYPAAVVAEGLRDAASGGNLLFFGLIVASDGVTPAPKTVSLAGGVALRHAAGTLQIALD